LGYDQPRDSHVHGRPSHRRTMSERSLADNHGQIRILLTLPAVRLRGHSYHSQADSAGSIPVTRSTRENCCHSYELGAILDLDRDLWASEISTRAITRAISHLGECPWRLSVPQLPSRNSGSYCRLPTGCDRRTR